MPEAYIVDAIRTPVGRKKGSLAGLHPADLGAAPIKALMARSKIDPGAVDDVIYGAVDTLGPLAGDIARTCWLVAGLPDHVPGVTVDRQCGSAQQAVHFAAQAVMSGTQDLIVAGGVANMNMVPIASAMVVGAQFGAPDPFSTSPGWQARYGDQKLGQFYSAQRIADHWQITRDEMEGFALASHERALASRDAFAREITPIEGLTQDEPPRADTSLEKMATLNPILEDGTVHAGVSSQNADAAAALLIASEQAVKDHGLTPRARIHHMSVRADDPVWMLTAPIPATRHALAKTGMNISDIDLFECNEAFASIPMAWMKELDIPHARVNTRGGAIALGHPLGATGARLMVTLLHALEDTGGRYGLQTMCEGGGQANVTIIERL